MDNSVSNATDPNTNVSDINRPSLFCTSNKSNKKAKRTQFTELDYQIMFNLYNIDRDSLPTSRSGSRVSAEYISQ